MVANFTAGRLSTDKNHAFCSIRAGHFSLIKKQHKEENNLNEKQTNGY